MKKKIARTIIVIGVVAFLASGIFMAGALPFIGLIVASVFFIWAIENA